MPKSTRAKVTTLSKTPSRSTKAAKLALATEIHNEIDKYDHVWLFSVGDMRNEALKDVRSQWRGTGRMFFGRGKVMKKALGEGEGDEYAEGLSGLSKHISGQTGLFLTSHPVDETADWFASYSRPEYARQHFLSTRTITLPSGPILTPLILPPLGSDASVEQTGDPFPHSMEPQLRSLGLKTTLVKGVPSFMDEHVLCRKGEKLSSEKCRILKLLGVQMAEFRIHLGSRWTKGQGVVKGDDAVAGDEAEDGAMDEDDEE